MTDPLAEIMRKMRGEYLKGVPERIGELKALLERVERGEPMALDELRRALHKLAGSGGYYGFDAISTASRAGEHLAKELLDLTGGIVPAAETRRVRGSVDAAVHALEAALAAGDEPPPANA